MSAILQEPPRLACVSTKDVHTAEDPGWTLLWCNERCHKLEVEGFREALREAVEEADGCLVCLKKAAVYERWINRQTLARSVLLCDWREAKPCLNVLEQCPENQPRCIIIYTDSERQHKAAVRWAETTKFSSFHVRVVQGDLHPTELVGYVTSLPRMKDVAKVSHLCDDCSTSCGSPASCTEDDLLSEGSPLAAEKDPHYFWQAPTSPPGCWEMPMFPLLAPEPWQDEKHPIGQWTTPFTVAPLQVAPVAGQEVHVDDVLAFPFAAEGALRWTLPVAQMMGSIFPQESSTEVRQALSMALPDHYED